MLTYAIYSDAHRQRTIDWIDGTGGLSCAFDFTTKAILQVRSAISGLEGSGKISHYGFTTSLRKWKNRSLRCFTGSL
jgi:hypothetical protein